MGGPGSGPRKGGLRRLGGMKRQGTVVHYKSKSTGQPMDKFAPRGGLKALVKSIRPQAMGRIKVKRISFPTATSRDF